MFTGIIEDLGKVVSLVNHGGDVRLTIATQSIKPDAMKEGDSVAINGACMTILQLSSNQFNADVSRESLAVTSLKHLRPGQWVNLETSLRMGDSIDGHMVSGHVDTTTTIHSLRNDGRSWRVRLAMPTQYAKFVAAKGSVTLDGVSLTVNEVTAKDFGVNIIPHTYENTLFKHYKVGSELNLEVDLIARYTARLLECQNASQ